jgi:excisionase family DNA binding protein|tara:strand:- start:223 stop:438 length:216 start_codon:yes stop_codon:yes gene_type:complete
MQIILNKLNEILQYVKSTDPSRYMTIKEVSDFCGISDSTIRRNISKGVLKCSKRTGKVLLKVVDVERWLNN